MLFAFSLRVAIALASNTNLLRWNMDFFNGNAVHNGFERFYEPNSPGGKSIDVVVKLGQNNCSLTPSAMATQVLRNALIVIGSTRM